MPKPIATGSVVQLLGGGPAMTVCLLADGHATCTWFANVGDASMPRWSGPFTATYPLDALCLSKEEK